MSRIVGTYVEMSRAIDAYLSGYEVPCGSDGFRQPSEVEYDIIRDAVQGLLADEAFLATVQAWQDAMRGTT